VLERGQRAPILQVVEPRLAGDLVAGHSVVAPDLDGLHLHQAVELRERQGLDEHGPRQREGRGVDRHAGGDGQQDHKADERRAPKAAQQVRDEVGHGGKACNPRQRPAGLGQWHGG
jgi:hypothetical protein